MNYPLISEYTQAILSAEDNFDELSYLRPVLDEFGMPIMSSGNFAVVYKMQDSRDGKFHAVKCFTRDQDGRDEAYKKISSYFKDTPSNYLIPVSYHKYELFVDSSQTEDTEFPILLMEWVEGITLDEYIKRYNGNPFVLYELCYNFRIMAKWLKEQSFAHGDLKPDNILVKENGDIVLIDYDGMYVPSMSNEQSREKGTPDYRHPFMVYPFDNEIDDFALAVIALSLKVISISYGIQGKYTTGSGLLFSENDFIDIENNELFSFVRSLMSTEPQLVLYYNTFLKCLYRNKLGASDFDFSDEKPLYSLLNVWGNTVRITSDRIKKGFLSPNGLIYNKDRTLVIGFDDEHEYNGEELFIEEGTIGICEDAFESYEKYKLKLHFPSTLRYFNRKSLNYKYSSLSWDSPWFTYVGGCILTKDKTECVLVHLQNNTFDDEVSIISAYTFEYLDFDGIWPQNLKIIRHDAFHSSNVPDKLSIPEGVISIERAAFRCCTAKNVFLPSSLIDLGAWSFQLCKNLEKVVFHSDCKLKEIKESTFSNDKKLREINFCHSILKIGHSAFMWCSCIESLSLPSSLIEIGEEAFNMSSFGGDKHESGLTDIVFPASLKKIGKSAFSYHQGLSNVAFNAYIEDIGERAFFECSNLKNLVHFGIGNIQSNAFSGCNIVFDNLVDVENIEPGALNGCTIKSVDGSSFIIKADCLYSEDFKELIYSWSKNSTIEIEEGVTDVYKDAFLYTPIALILPNSFNEDNLRNVSFAPILVVPKHFKERNGYEGSKILHDKVFVDSEGVIYSEDKKSLILFPRDLTLETYSVIKECEIIKEHSFEEEVDPDPEFGVSYYGNKLKHIFFTSDIANHRIQFIYRLPRIIRY